MERRRTDLRVKSPATTRAPGVTRGPPSAFPRPDAPTRTNDGWRLYSGGAFALSRGRGKLGGLCRRARALSARLGGMRRAGVRECEGQERLLLQRVHPRRAGGGAGALGARDGGDGAPAQ